MTKRRNRRKSRCLLNAGPNGAGKTTFARTYLPDDARVLHFVNADLIAGGLSPLKPELAAVAGARLMLKEIDRLIDSRSLPTNREASRLRPQHQLARTSASNANPAPS